jgi:hypothetical protein
MKYILIIGFLLLKTQISLAQNKRANLQEMRKGKLYFYWGWNWDSYSKSNINFAGKDYNFTLKDVVAKDRQSEFTFAKYFGITQISIPQYNFRVGYFIKDNWDISFGIDHMKYIVQAYQTVKISGTIENSGTEYDGQYSNDDSVIAEDFLQFEHTDGLNYLNIELRRFDKIFDFNKIDINLTEGFGVGALVPKTNTALLNIERHDEFHLSGYGVSAMAGINVSFFDKFFIQTELKGGYINMPNIRTTNSATDGASQSLFFNQFNIVFGGILNFASNTKSNKK